PGRPDRGRLPFPELARGLRLQQVVHAGRAAARPAVAHLGEFQPGDRAEQIARLLADPLRVGQVTGVVVRGPDRQLVARRPPGAPPAWPNNSARNSLRSRTLPLAASARAAQPAELSPARSAPYSFIAEPQPAELTTIASTPARSNVAMVRRANPAASEARPECSDSAPQQPCPAGMMTSQPSAASTRAVAALTAGKKTCC